MQKTNTNGVQDLVYLRGEDDLLWIVQEVKIWPDYQMAYTRTRIWAREWDSWNSLKLVDTKWLPKPGLKTTPNID